MRRRWRGLRPKRPIHQGDRFTEMSKDEWERHLADGRPAAELQRAELIAPASYPTLTW